MLRAPERQGPDRRDAVPSVVHRNHICGDRQDFADKIPIITAGYGRADSVEGEVFPYNFPLLGTYWSAADILVQHVAKINGGFDKLKGKKITLVYHDSPYGKEPIPLLTERSKLHGFELTDDSGDASWRGTEGRLAADSTEPS